MKIFFMIMISIMVFVVGFLVWASYPWNLGEKKVSGELLEVEPEGMMDFVDSPTVIKVLTWNLGFLYGEGSEGEGYEKRSSDFYERRLKELARQIKEWEVDVICLQEIDFNSSRSGHIDQAEFLARMAGFPYVAKAVSWNANYIPFPYWPLKRNFGAMSSGGAVLSKYPILSQEVYLLQKPQSQPWWYNIFYLYRYFQEVRLEVGNQHFKIVNLHLEAFDKENRKEQIQKLNKIIVEDKLDIVTGDFNMLPKSASKRSNFANNDNYENDTSYDLMMESQLSEVIPDDIYAKDESLYFTFPAWKPDRRLDYVFYRPELKMMKAEVLPSALSDHLPIRVTFQIDSPKFNPYSL
jgi:endonuclease/exonuclease/phosphatase family metal-dependent hydrolase